MAAALFLRSEEGLCPDIQLPSGHQVNSTRNRCFNLETSNTTKKQKIWVVKLCLFHERHSLQVIIGRGPLTGLKDKRVGRRQLVLTVDGEKVQVFRD